MNETCQTHRESLSAYISGELSPAEHHSLEKHLAECPECDREEQSLRKTWDILDLYTCEGLDAVSDDNILNSVQRQNRKHRYVFAFAAAAAVVMLAGTLTFLFINTAPITLKDGNARITGNEISTENTSATVRLRNGAVLTLAPHSHAALEKESILNIHRGSVTASGRGSGKYALTLRTSKGDVLLEDTTVSISVESVPGISGASQERLKYATSVSLQVEKGSAWVNTPKYRLTLAALESTVLIQDASPLRERHFKLRETVWNIIKEAAQDGLSRKEAALLGKTRDELAVPILLDIVLDPEKNYFDKIDIIRNTLYDLAESGVAEKTILNALDTLRKENPWKSDGWQLGAETAGIMCALGDDRGTSYLRKLMESGDVAGWRPVIAFDLLRGGDNTYMDLIDPAVGSIVSGERYTGERALLLYKAGRSEIKTQVENWLRKAVSENLKNTSSANAMITPFLKILGQMSDQKISPVLKEYVSLSSKDGMTQAWIKSSALTALGLSGHSEAAEIIKKSLKQEKSTFVLLNGARALQKLGDRSLDKKILEILKKDAAAALDALKQKDNGPDAEKLAEKTAWKAAVAFRELDSPKIRKLLTDTFIRNAENIPEKSLLEALDTLGHTGTEAELPALEKLLETDSEKIKNSAAICILRILRKIRETDSTEI